MVDKEIILKSVLRTNEVLLTEVKAKPRIPIKFLKIGAAMLDSAKILSEMKPQEAKAFIKLRNAMSFEDNTSTCSTVGLTKSQIKSQRTGLNRLKKLDVIKEIKRGEFIFNPYFLVPNGDKFKQIEEKYNSIT